MRTSLLPLALGLLSVAVLSPAEGEVRDALTSDVHIETSQTDDYLSVRITLQSGLPSVVYCPRPNCLAQTIGSWLRVEFHSNAGDTFQVRSHTSIMWPTREGVRHVAPGESVETDFKIRLGERYYLEKGDGTDFFGLPPGRYSVVASLVVPEDGPAARLGLTAFRTTSNADSLEIRSDLAEATDKQLRRSPIELYSKTFECLCDFIRHTKRRSATPPRIIVLDNLRPIWLVGVVPVFDDREIGGDFKKVLRMLSLRSTSEKTQQGCRFESWSEEIARTRLQDSNVVQGDSIFVLKVSELGKNQFTRGSKASYGVTALFWAEPAAFAAVQPGETLWVPLSDQPEDCNPVAILPGAS